MTMPTTIPKEWVDAHAAVLDDPTLKPSLKLLSFSTGSGDSLLPVSKATVELFKAHGYNPIFLETGGVHSWSNWRDYLHDYLPKLFR